MRITIDPEKFLSLPIFDNPEICMAYTLMVCLADVTGCVPLTVSQLSARLGVSVSSTLIVLRTLELHGLISQACGSIAILPCKAWTSPTAARRNPPTRPSTAPSGGACPVAAGAADFSRKSDTTIEARVEAFRLALQQEVRKWDESHEVKFPKEEADAFLLYWTEHGERDRTFRKELEKKWSWQGRLTTWFRNAERRGGHKAGRQLSATQYRQEQNELLDRTLREMDDLAGGYQQYLSELKLARQGDAAMRGKYPDWERLCKVNQI